MTEPRLSAIQQRRPAKSRDTTPPDLLNDLLDALCVDASALYVFDLHEPWQIDLSDVTLSFSWTVMEGTVWIYGPDDARTVLHPGDTFLLPSSGARKTKIVVTHPDHGPISDPTSSSEVFRQLQLPKVDPRGLRSRPLRARWGGQGPKVRVVSAAFGLTDSKLRPLFTALPPLMVVRAGDTGNELAQMLAHVALNPDGAGQPGFSALATQIAQLLLVHIVRTHALTSGSTLGWLAGLGDPQIARALAIIHREPASRWSVAALARASGLSRSVFAARFYAQVGQTVMTYLRAWRMHLAREALLDSDVSISELALDLGYQSEAAFRAVFRRATGASPTAFRRTTLQRQDGDAALGFRDEWKPS